VFYGWLVVASVFLAQFFMVGFFTYGFPLIVEPVQIEFGASVTEVMLGFSLGAPVGAVFAPIVGPLVDKWSARGLVIIGVLILILALTIMSLSQTVLQFAIAMGVLLGSANLLLGPLTGSTLVARWFDSRRGFALGIAATGTSVGGIVIPQVLGYQIAEADWRAALQALAAGVAIVVLPLAVFIIRDFPGDLGLHPDGAEAASSQAQSAGGADALTLTQVLKRSAFWLMGCSLGCLFMAYVGVLSNLHKYATNLGVDPQSATGLITTIAVAGFIGKLVLGWAADRIGLKIGLWVAQALAIAGIGCLSLEPAFPVMLVGAVLMGLAAGGMLPVWGAMVGTAFGVANFGRVMGLMMPVIAIFNIPGPILAAKSMDLTQSYSSAMQGFVGVIIVSALLLIPLRLPIRDDPAGGAKRWSSAVGRTT